MVNDKLVKAMWAAYDKSAGGKTFDNKPLPTWEELGEDRQNCWRAAASVFDDYVADSNFLSLLRVAGVNNWNGYSYAIEMLDDET